MSERQARVFGEPLAPLSEADPGTPQGADGSPAGPEEAALAQALKAFAQRKSRDDFGPFEGFLAKHPESRWNASLLTNVGLARRQAGWFEKAGEDWETAWRLCLDNASRGGDSAEEVENLVLSRLLDHHAALCQTQKLRALIEELRARPSLEGPLALQLSHAAEALRYLEGEPTNNMLCGPWALMSLNERLQQLQIIDAKLAYNRKVLQFAQTDVNEHLDIGREEQMHGGAT